MKILIVYFIAFAMTLNVSCSSENKVKEPGSNDSVGNNSVKGNNSSFRLEKTWETGRDFRVAESVQYDKNRERIYVSNIDGQPMDKDGKGFISIMNTNGQIQKLEWITGLNAPKGMGIIGNLLYVTDIDKLIEIDIEKAAIINTYPVKGAQFLNDIAVGDDGSLYISDMEASCIYLFHNGNASKWMDIPRPNGMLFEGGKLYIGCMPEKAVYEVIVKDKSRKVVAKNNSSIDGLKIFGEGIFIVSDWSGKTNIIGKDGVVSELLDTTNDKIQSADLEYIKEFNLLLIPTFFDNRVVAYKVVED